MNEAGEIYKPKSCTNNIKVDANDRSEHQPWVGRGSPGRAPKQSCTGTRRRLMGAGSGSKGAGSVRGQNCCGIRATKYVFQGIFHNTHMLPRGRTKRIFMGRRRPAFCFGLFQEFTLELQISDFLSLHLTSLHPYPMLSI